MIKYKLIEHERTQDAPFVGTLICAIDCKFNCKNCFNQHLKKLPDKEAYVGAIIDEVKSNPLNQGIILSGLEWTNQMADLQLLIRFAKFNDLKIILYTGLDYDEFVNLAVKYDLECDNIYIKTGRYNEDLKCEKTVLGVKLASSNQNIYYNGEKK